MKLIVGNVVNFYVPLILFICSRNISDEWSVLEFNIQYYNFSNQPFNFDWHMSRIIILQVYFCIVSEFIYFVLNLNYNLRNIQRHPNI